MDTIRFDAQCNYTISVQGFISQGLYDMIPDISITVQNEEQLAVTFIHVKVKDQAQLIAILNRLYDTRCVILKVKLDREPVLNTR